MRKPGPGLGFNSTAALGGSAAVLFFAALGSASPFATQVLDYTPAPGQNINLSAWNDPFAALGPPNGGGTLSPNNEDLVSIGGFGGSITLGFDHTVFDNPLNPFGLDAIVFGNAFYTGGDPTRRFAEAGIIEISRDVNGNGLPDDPWYLIPGSSLPSVPDAAFTQPWDNDPNTPTPPANIAWYPDPDQYPSIPAAYSTSGFLLPTPFHGIPLVNPGGSGSTKESYYGYADMSPVLVLGDLNADNIVEDPSVLPEQFYTRPDNPFEVGVRPGSGGGDAFDIAWAVDPFTGEPARLDGFDFIRISTGANAMAGILGEISTEVSAVAATSAEPLFYDLNDDESLDLEDLYAWHQVPADLSGDGTADETDRLLVQRAVRAGERLDTLGGQP
ncbi:MAG: hypothetical protein ACIAQF_05075 [Phycisphaerales bacterium JB065]